jgi:hypothetical protein
MDTEAIEARRAPLVAAVEADGRRATGVDTGLGPTAFAQSKSAALLTEMGFLVGADGAVSEWRAEGVAEIGGSMVVYGPSFPGSSLLDAMDAAARGAGSAGAEAALRLVLRRAEAWAAAKAARPEAGGPPPPCATLAAPDGAFLFLPPKLAERALGWRTAAERISGAASWSHPDLAADGAEAFALAALAYRAFVGAAPFSGADEDALRAAIRDGDAERAALARPGLDAALAAAVDAALFAPAAQAAPARGPRAAQAPRPTTEQLRAAIAGALDRGVVREVDAAEIERVREARERAARKRTEAIGRGRFFKRHRTALIVSAVAAVALSLTAKSFIDSAKSAPTTAGMEAEEVAAAYYRAMGSLDHQLMDACVADGAGKRDIEATMNLFVISKVRTAYERQVAYQSAEEWVAAGSPETEAIVYGPSDLRIEAAPSGVGADRAEFAATYRFWTREAAEGTDAAGGQTAYPAAVMRAEARRDLLVLEKRKDRWRIVSMDRTVVPPAAP